ncbi:MAG TPA: alpha/beta fold hydrolase [Candidatus Acidoferrales bacterium]|nr:alpha/beta fold hydrolase [Candidatus Acidoferrales bacterium]
MAASTFVLVHSPIVGSDLWRPVAAVLRRRGHPVAVAELGDEGSGPYWERHARSAAAWVPRGSVLVGHSGAGPLLPAIAKAAGGAAGYIFVDAGLPLGGGTRLSTLPPELREPILAGRSFPEWDEETLAAVVPDPVARRKLVGGLTPRGLDFFNEPIPAVDGWPDAPCGYLLWSPPYQEPAAQARSLGWPVRECPAGHFHMLVDPVAVAGQLLELASSL